MHDEPPKDLATRAFQKRVLDEFAGLRREVSGELSAIRAEIAEIRLAQRAVHSDITEIRAEQTATAHTFAGLDHSLMAFEQKIESNLRETRPIWEDLQERLQRIGERLEGVLVEFYESRHEIRVHGRRIGELERRVN